MIAWLLNDYLRKNEKLDGSDPTIDTLNVSNTLKSELLEITAVTLFQIQRPYMSDTGASAYALEAVRLQMRNDRNLNEYAAIYHYNWVLNQAKQDYLATERNYLGTV